jgi:hypothetical protein
VIRAQPSDPSGIAVNFAGNGLSADTVADFDGDSRQNRRRWPPRVFDVTLWLNPSDNYEGVPWHGGNDLAAED